MPSPFSLPQRNNKYPLKRAKEGDCTQPSNQKRRPDCEITGGYGNEVVGSDSSIAHSHSSNIPKTGPPSFFIHSSTKHHTTRDNVCTLSKKPTRPNPQTSTALNITNVVNLSTHYLSQSEIEVLALGLGFCPDSSMNSLKR